MAFTVERFYTNYFIPAPPTELGLTAQRYSINAIGGYEQAQIAIGTSIPLRLWDALHWLGYYVLIRNDWNNVVWAGKVTSVEVDFGGMALGKSLDDMANRVQVAYSETDAYGSTQQGTTDWADNLPSQAAYGIKEVVQSEGDSDAAQAVKLRDRALDMIGSPVPTPSSIGQEISGTITCKGLWSTTAWRIFNQPGGVAKYEDTGGFEHLLGWGLISNVIAFYAPTDAIHDLTGRLTDLRTDDQVIVSGAANGANNGIFTIDQTANIDAVPAFTSTAISFDAVDDIKRTAGGLGFVQASQLLKVVGSSSSGNNRYYFAKSDLADDHITVTPLTITTSGAGPSVTISQGHSATTTGSLVTEFPANTITLTALGSVLGQSWKIPVDSTWPIVEVYIRAKKVGNPVDSLSVAIRADSSGSPAGVSLESVSILGSTLPDEMNWIKFTFSSGITPVFGVNYWLLTARTGANSPTDYYVIELNEDAGYTDGVLKLFNGSTWIARSWGADNKNASMPFQIWGHVETTEQINQMLTASNQFFDVFDFRDTSALYSRLYRDANQTAQTEIENLMKAGDYSGKRFLSSVTPDRVVHIFAESDYDRSIAPLLDVYDKNHSLLDVSGQPYEPGKLPVGKWVTLTGVPVNVDEFVGMEHQFVERAEWDVESGKLSALEFKGAPSPWDVTKLV